MRTVTAIMAGGRGEAAGRAAFSVPGRLAASLTLGALGLWLGGLA